MTDMIKRVAAAISAVEIKLPGAGGLCGKLTISPAWAEAMARAAIEAMREPTDDMEEAAMNAYDGEPGLTPHLVWAPMINAALQ